MEPIFKKVIIGFLILIIPIGLILKRAVAIEIQKKVVETLSISNSQNDIDKAIKRINLAIRLAPRNYLFYSTKAQILENQKKYHEAITEYKKIYDFKDYYPEGYMAIGMNYERLSIEDSAKIFYHLSLDSYNYRIKTSSESREKLFSAKINRAFVYALLDDTTNSRIEFRQLKIDYPEYVEMIEHIESFDKEKDLLKND